MNLRALQQFTDEIFGAPQPTTKQFVAQWGFCPHLADELCADCLSNPSERSFCQSELLDLTHERQVAIFGWCYCEHNEGNDELFTDCPEQGDNQ